VKTRSAFFFVAPASRRLCRVEGRAFSAGGENGGSVGFQALERRPNNAAYTGRGKKGAHCHPERSPARFCLSRGVCGRGTQRGICFLRSSEWRFGIFSAGSFSRGPFLWGDLSTFNSKLPTPDSPRRRKAPTNAQVHPQHARLLRPPWRVFELRPRLSTLNSQLSTPHSALAFGPRAAPTQPSPSPSVPPLPALRPSS